MSRTTRRAFLQAGALAAGAMACPWVAPEGWLTMARGEASGYFETGFGITDEVCRRLLAQALSKGGDYADLYFEHKIVNALVLEDGQVNQAYGNVDLGVGIRTVKGDQVGYAFTQDLTEPSMLAAAATAASIADAAAGQVAPQFVSVAGGNYYPADTLFSAVPVADKLPLVQAVNDKCFARSKAVAKVNCGLRDEQKTIMVVTSEGQKAVDLLPRSDLCKRRGGKRRPASRLDGISAGAQWFRSLLPRWSIDWWTRRSTTCSRFEAVQPPAGGCRGPRPRRDGRIAPRGDRHGMEADFNRKKTSTYATMLGKKVAERSSRSSTTARIEHDRLDQRRRRSHGKPEDGARRSGRVDQLSARSHLRPALSGATHRQRPPRELSPLSAARMRNTMHAPGRPRRRTSSRASSGASLSSRCPTAGENRRRRFAFYVPQGRMIENGKLTAPIKDVNIMARPKMLLGVSMVANDWNWRNQHEQLRQGGQWVPVSFGLPTTLVHSMTVGGTKRQERRR